MVVFDRLVSVVVALVLLALGFVTAVEVIHTAVGNYGYALVPWDDLARFGRRHSWDSAPVIVISSVVTAVGLALLIAELRPRRPGILALTTGDELVLAGTTRRSVARALSARAAEVPGVASAHARLHRHTAVVSAVTDLPDPAGLRERLTTELSEWLDHLDLNRPPELRVHLHRRRH